MVGWLENIDTDLANSKSINKEKRSSVERARWKEAIKKVQVNECFLHLYRLVKSKAEVRDLRAKITKSVDVFIERVTITGVVDAHKSKIPLEKCMWYAAYVMACVGIIFTSANIAYQYMRPPIVYDDYPISGHQAPFPNVTICSPEQIDKNKLRAKLVVPEKIKNMAQRKNLSLDDVVDFALDIWRLDAKLVEYDNELKAQAACKIIDATAPGNMFRTLQDALPKCEEVLSDCYFQNRRFDCCRAARFSFYDNYVCYHISLSRIQEFEQAPAVTGGPLPDAVREETSGLVVNASINWRITTSANDVTMDGFLLIIGPTASLLSDPVAIPANADALVTLAPPKKIEELGQCRSNFNLPRLNFFSYYDQEGVHCASNEVIQFFRSNMGYEIPFYNYMPENENQCPCMMGLIASRALNSVGHSEIDVFMSKISEGFQDSRYNNKYKQLFSLFITGGVSSIMRNVGCLQLCNRWKYKVNSASYGYVRLRGQAQWDRDMKNRSWSRIRIYFPESSYHLHKERKANAIYVSISNIAVQFGVYVGASVISVVQLFAYGTYVLYIHYHFRKKIKKLNKVSVTRQKMQITNSNKIVPM